MKQTDLSCSADGLGTRMGPQDNAFAGTCKTCKHWQKYTGGSPREAIGGHCHNELIAEDFGSESYKPNALVYPYNEGAGAFWTGPEFGCVNHEDRQPMDTRGMDPEADERHDLGPETA